MLCLIKLDNLNMRIISCSVLSTQPQLAATERGNVIPATQLLISSWSLIKIQVMHAVLCQVLPKQQNIAGLNNCRAKKREGERPDSTTQEEAEERERGEGANYGGAESVPFVRCKERRKGPEEKKTL